MGLRSRISVDKKLGESSAPVRVTVCAAFHVVDVKVSEAGNTVPRVVSELAKSSTTFAVGPVASVTPKVAVRPSSLVCNGDVVDVADDDTTISAEVCAAAGTAIPAVTTSPRAIASSRRQALASLFAVVIFAPQETLRMDLIR